MTVSLLLMLVPFSAPIELTAQTRAKLEQIAFQAAREGDTKTLREYFRLGMPVNVVNERGDSLLILAVYHGQTEAAALILRQPGLEVGYRNRMGFNALDGAAFKGNVELIQQLIQAGAKVNAQSPSGRTALMLAAMTNRLEAAKELLAAGADASLADERGTTALKLAELQGAEALVNLLRQQK
ncbi:MAG: ankyrin repeat domain-containing protein [Gemmataceae bacterium]